MKTLIAVALWVVGLFAIGMTIYSFFQEKAAKSNFMHTVIWLIVALICAFIWILICKKKESEEEISITK